MRRSRRTVLLTAVSWEERFLVGLDRLLTQERPEIVMLLRYGRDSERTYEYQERAVKMCEENGCEVRSVDVGVQPTR